MTAPTRPVPPAPTRAHLEALLIALAIVRPELLAALRAGVDRDRVSPEAWTLLAQLADDDVAVVHAQTEAQRRLADNAERIMVGELLGRPLEALVAAVNDLPVTRRARTSAMDIGTETAA